MKFEDNMNPYEGVKWFGAGMGTCSSKNGDVLVKVYIPNENTKSQQSRVNIFLHNRLPRLFGDNDRVLIAIVKNRLIFKPNKNNGYKLSKRDENNTHCCIQIQLGENDIAQFKKFLGEHEIHRDDFWDGYFYITADAEEDD